MRKPYPQPARGSGRWPGTQSRRPSQPRAGPSLTEPVLENKDSLEKCVFMRAAVLHSSPLRQSHELILGRKEASFLKHHLPSTVSPFLGSPSSGAQARVSRWEQKVLVLPAFRPRNMIPGRFAFKTGPNFAAPPDKCYMGQSLSSQCTPTLPWEGNQGCCHSSFPEEEWENQR